MLRTYRDVCEALRERREFRHSNMSARWIAHLYPTTDDGGMLHVDDAKSYVVYSEGTPIVWEGPDGTVVLTTKRNALVSTIKKNMYMARDVLIGDK